MEWPQVTKLCKYRTLQTLQTLQKYNIANKRDKNLAKRLLMNISEISREQNIGISEISRYALRMGWCSSTVCDIVKRFLFC